MITQITYARLYNLGNYENERLEVQVTVEDGDIEQAWIAAREAIEAERERAREAERRRREEKTRAEDIPF